MADVAPLTAAHEHARKAAEETHQINWPQAAEEHQTAAADFARAARGTNDSEALRVLKLLEEQHLKLARIIKTQDVSDHFDLEPLPGDLPNSAETGLPSRDVTHPEKSMPPISPRTKSTTTALAAAQLGSQARDSSPSLARDIASRRGIPQPRKTPPSAAAQARARQLSPESHRRNRSGPVSKPPASVVESQNLHSAKQAEQDNDDGFAKFYSNLTTGTMSKLSSVLAYAGLPLAAEEPSPEQSKLKLNKRTVSASNEPDVKKYFSKAALTAIEDDHRQRGAQGHIFGPAESFYVVQKGGGPGGPFSYADVAKPPHQLGGIDEDDEEAFEDAREAQAPASPRHSRTSGHSRGSFGKSRTHEELELENSTLKGTLEQLATRLAEFENHAQDASMAALTQSMARVKLLERQLEQSTEERQQLQNLSAKQEKTLKQYKSKWDDIKKSAREKERAKKEKLERTVEEASAANEAS